MTDDRRAATSTVGSIFAPEYRVLTFGITAFITIAAFEWVGVSTSMPVAVRDLGGVAYYAWVFTSFIVASLYAMVVGGEWADRHGPLRPLGVGAASMAVGTLVAGLAPDLPVMLVGRTLQGFGSGAAVVAIYVLIGRVYPDQLRPRMFTALSGAWVVPGIVGPAIAGSVTDSLGWRWVFLGVLVLMVPVAVLLLPRLLAQDLPGNPGFVAVSGRKRRAALAAGGAGLLQLAGQRMDGWSWPLAAFGLGLLASSVPPLLPPGTLRAARGLPTVVAVRGLVAGGFFAAESFLPLMLVRERGLSSAAAGLALSGAAVGWFLGSWYQGRPTTPRSRAWLVSRGSWLVVLGIATTSVALLPAVPPLVAVGTWGVGALGMGMLFGSLGVLLLELSPEADQGTNSAALQVSDSLGSLLCTGAAGAVFATWHALPGQDAAVFFVIFLGASAVAGVGALVSGRVRPRHAGTG